MVSTNCADRDQMRAQPVAGCVLAYSRLYSAQIGMHQATHLIHDAHHLDELAVQRRITMCRYGRILQTRIRPANMASSTTIMRAAWAHNAPSLLNHRVGSSATRAAATAAVPATEYRPHADVANCATLSLPTRAPSCADCADYSRGGSGTRPSRSGHGRGTSDGRLVHFDGAMLARLRHRMVHIGLRVSGGGVAGHCKVALDHGIHTHTPLTRADASVDLVDDV